MISIARRLKPFSHLPGTTCIIPKTQWQVQVFPTLLRFTNLVTFKTFEEKLKVKGPILDFTVELDLEKCIVRIFGHVEKKYHQLVISEKNIFDLFPGVPLPDETKKERLDLGVHTKLDWELVARRRDMLEIFPIWFRLGQLVPLVETPKVGAATLLHSCDKMEVFDHFRKLFMAGFHGIMAPRLSDNDHQGIIPEGNFTFSPLGLLSEGARLIRQLFFHESKNTFSFLPHLPPECHAGRLLHLRSSFGDEIDIEWSKKLLRRVVIRPGASREIQLDLQKALKSYRINRKTRKAADNPLALEAGKILYLDNFQK
jgi:hypothetical protein